MKRTISILLLFFALVAVRAQNTDGGATPILKAVAQKYQALSSMKIDYTYQVEKEKKVLEKLTGTLVFKDKNYKVEFDDQEIFCNGNTIWNYQKSVNEVSIFEYDPDDDDNLLLNPAKLLANWQKSFTAKFIREENSEGKMLQIIDLKPIKAQQFYKIRLFVNKKTQELAAISAYDKDNTIYSYAVDKFVPNVPCDAALFTFDKTKYPNISINDMR